MLRRLRDRRLPALLAALFAASGWVGDWHAVSHDHVETELHAALAEPVGDHVERPESVGHGTPATPPCFLHGVAAENIARPAAVAKAPAATADTVADARPAATPHAAWRYAPKQSPPIA